MKQYIDPIVSKYIDLFKATNKDIVQYFHGEPFQIGKTSMPAVFISKRGTEVRTLTNASDEHSVLMRATVVVDVRSEIGDEKEIVAGIAKLTDIIEGRKDDGTYKLKDTALLDILRANVTVDSANNLRTDLSTITRVDYSELLNRRREQWFVESHIEFVAVFAQTR